MRSPPAANLTTGALADCDRNPRTLGFRRSEKDEPALVSVVDGAGSASDLIRAGYGCSYNHVNGIGSQ